MTNNLHVSYDLNKPGQNYEPLIAKIKTLGNWAKIQKSFWYINSVLTAEQAVEILWKVMDANDSLYVVNATNNSASWRGLSKEAEAQIKQQWNVSLPQNNRLPA